MTFSHLCLVESGMASELRRQPSPETRFFVGDVDGPDLVQFDTRTGKKLFSPYSSSAQTGIPRPKPSRLKNRLFFVERWHTDMLHAPHVCFETSRGKVFYR